MHKNDQKNIAPQLRWLWYIAIALLVIWGSGVVSAPPFDLDEALYRRMAEEMKGTGQFIIPTWDTHAYHDKPPTYLWSIAGISTLLDAPGIPVSILSLRLPSLLFTYGTVFLLAFFWRRLMTGFARQFSSAASGFPPWLLHPAFPIIAFGTATLPVFGASAVLLDPMLTLAYMPSLILMTLVFLEGDKHTGFPRKFTALEAIFLGASLGTATAIKGLIGIFIPGLAVCVHALFSIFIPKQLKLNAQLYFHALTVAKSYLKIFLAPFALAASLSFAFYSWIYTQGGSRFVYDFFITHHFGRGSQAMEGHGGSLLYHPLVVYLGGTTLSSLCLLLLSRCLMRTRPRNIRETVVSASFPITWCLSFVVFFSAMATKLPNYTWPVWPGLVLTLGAGFCWFFATEELLVKPSQLKIAVRNILHFLAILVPVLLSALFIFSGLFADLFIEKLPMDYRAKAVVMGMDLPWPWVVKAAFVEAGIAFGIMAILMRTAARKSSKPAEVYLTTLVGAAFANGFILYICCQFILPFAEEVVISPLRRLAVVSKTHTTTLATVGLFSPTVSTAFSGLSGVKQYSRGDMTPFTDSSISVILVPQWSEDLCLKSGFIIARKDRYVSLCSKQDFSQ